MAQKVAALRRQASDVTPNVDIVVVDVGVRRLAFGGGEGGGGGRGAKVKKTLEKIKDELQAKKVGILFVVLQRCITRSVCRSAIKYCFNINAPSQKHATESVMYMALFLHTGMHE